MSGAKLFQNKTSLVKVDTQKLSVGLVVKADGSNIVLRGMQLQAGVQTSADYSITRALGSNMLFQTFGAAPAVISVTGVSSAIDMQCDQAMGKGLTASQFYTKYGIYNKDNRDKRIQISLSQSGSSATVYSCILVDIQQQLSTQGQGALGPVSLQYKLTFIGVPM